VALEDEIKRLAIAVETLTAKMFRVPKPGLLSIIVTAERQLQLGASIVDFLKFKVLVPAADGDVVSRKVSVTTSDGVPQVLTVSGKAAAETAEFEVEQGSEVTVEAVNIDDAGNVSEARVQTFVVNDTIAPAAPGELGIEVTGERTE